VEQVVVRVLWGGDLETTEEATSYFIYTYLVREQTANR